MHGGHLGGTDSKEGCKGKRGRSRGIGFRVSWVWVQDLGIMGTLLHGLADATSDMCLHARGGRDTCAGGKKVSCFGNVRAMNFRSER